MARSTAAHGPAAFTTFGALLRYLRRRQRLTQIELAIATGYSTAQISRLELNQRVPNPATIDALFVPALGLSDEAELIAQLHELARDAKNQRDAPADAGGVASAPSYDRSMGNQPVSGSVPVRRDLLLGRETDVALVVALVRRPDVGLVTLTGAGGIGKTRLALAVAAALRDAYADGIWFVDLAPISDSTLVAPAIARVLGVVEQSNRPLLAQVQAFLSTKHLLLLLDNFEHLLAAAPLVAGLLRAAPDLAVLATSRAVLHVSGEHEWPVSPLPAVSAVNLFAQRARAARPAFALTAENETVISAICARLDGVPLAIELAAARAKLFAPEVLLNRLDQRVAWLTNGPRDVPARQQSIRATLDWSFDLLAAPEQALFRHLGVFVGGFTLAAAEAVCGTDAPEVVEPSRAHEALGGVRVADRLHALLDHSLLQHAEQSGALNEAGPRFAMLQLLRDYAYAHLVGHRDVGAVRQRHAEYYLALAEEADRAVEQGVTPLRWLAHLEAEHGNLRAALAWALDRQQSVLALRLGTALGEFWLRRGHYTDARRWLDAALALGAADPMVPPGVVAKALLPTAWIAHYQRDFARAESLWGTCQQLYQDLGDTTGIAAALSGRAWTAMSVGNLRRAAALREEQLLLVRELGDRQGIATALLGLGWIAHDQGDVERAVALFEENLVLQREVGDQQAIALALYSLGNAACQLGDAGRARRWSMESLTLAQELGDLGLIAPVLTTLGAIAIYQGDLERAATMLDQALVLKEQLGDQASIAVTLRYQASLASAQRDWAHATTYYQASLALAPAGAGHADIAACLEGVARVAAEQGRSQRAAQLWGAAEAIRERIGVPMPPVDRPRRKAALARLRTTLDGPTFDAAWVAGQAMTLEQAIAYALDERDDATLPSAAGAAHAEKSAESTTLSPE